MLKELRELIGFVLGFVTDIADLIWTSRLSSSPVQNLGRDRALSLQLSGVLGIILAGIFITTLSTKHIKIDLLPFAAITLIYFTLAAFVVGLAIRVFHRNDVDKRGDKKAQNSKEEPNTQAVVGFAQIDATSYVISFNLVALIVFAIARDLLNFLWGTAEIRLPSVAAVVIAAVVILAFGKKSGPEPGLSLMQKAAVTIVLVISFLGYAATLAKYGAAG